MHCTILKLYLGWVGLLLYQNHFIAWKWSFQLKVLVMGSLCQKWLWAFEEGVLTTPTPRPGPRSPLQQPERLASPSRSAGINADWKTSQRVCPLARKSEWPHWVTVAATEDWVGSDCKGKKRNAHTHARSTPEEQMEKEKLLLTRSLFSNLVLRFFFWKDKMYSAQP